jgi:hypothetical protein
MGDFWYRLRSKPVQNMIPLYEICERADENCFKTSVNRCSPPMKSLSIFP